MANILYVFKIRNHFNRLDSNSNNIGYSYKKKSPDSIDIRWRMH